MQAVVFIGTTVLFFGYLPILKLSTMFLLNISNNGGFLGGVGLGTIIAIVISWTRNKSILWAIVHGILGWFYIIYYLLFLPKNKV